MLAGRRISGLVTITSLAPRRGRICARSTGGWFADYNYQAHWAHRERTDGRHSPSEALGWVHGLPRTDEELNRVFRLRSERTVDRSGYVRYRHWRVYGERRLARQPAVVWLCAETLTVEHQDEPLSQFTVDLAPDNRHLRQVSAPRLFDTRFTSPQPFLWHCDDVEWHLVLRAPEYARRRKQRGSGIQGRSFP